MQFHFAFERECINGALLELITTSVKQSKANGRPIYLDPNPTERFQALCNLEAFSVDEGDNYDFAAFQAQGLKVFPANKEDEAAIKSINSCLGWMEFDTDEIERELEPLRRKFPPIYRELTKEDIAAGVLDRGLPEGKVFCLAYRFVPDEGPLDFEYVMRQSDFFHIVGFARHNSLRGDNWRGKGVLVDMSDIIPLHDRGWSQYRYESYPKGGAESTKYALEEMAQLRG